MKMSLILLVDDNETDQFLHEMVIKKFDPTIKILKAYDGEEALEVLANAEEAPDLILLDINMPRMNGFEFLEEYNKLSYTSTVVAMLSSSEQGSDREKALGYGCVETYFVKPLDSDDLQKMLDLDK